jgi:hypothetical protein
VLAIDDEPHDIERKKLLGVSNNWPQIFP